MILRRMGALVLLLPLIEIAVFVQVGARIGYGPAIFGLIAGIFVGLFVLRHEGRHALRKAQSAFARGTPIPHATFDALGRVMAGILFIFPGFFTDLLAALLLIGPLRRAVARRLTDRPTANTAPKESGRGRIIDGEYTTERKPRRH